jgi:hypothetical protein
MEKKSWRERYIWGRFDTVLVLLVLLELVLSMVFILMGYITGNIYFRGVGVGLVIAWVTSALAYFIVTLNTKRKT